MKPETRLIILTILAIRRELAMRELHEAYKASDQDGVAHWRKALDDALTAIKAMEDLKP